MKTFAIRKWPLRRYWVPTDYYSYEVTVNGNAHQFNSLMGAVEFIFWFAGEMFTEIDRETEVLR